MGCRKVPKSDFQSQFSMSKIIRIFQKNVFIEEYQCRRRDFFLLLLSFFENFNFCTTLFSKMVPNIWWSRWTSVKVKSKNYFHCTDLKNVLKNPPLRHWEHTNISWEDPIAPGEGWLQGSTTYDNYEGPDVRWEIWQGKWVGETSHTRKIEILGNDCEIVVLQKCKFNSIKTLTPLSSKGILWPLARGWQSNDSPKFNGSWKWCIKKPGKVESPKGHSSTTWTNFKPIMTTWPSWVDNFWQFT